MSDVDDLMRKFWLESGTSQVMLTYPGLDTDGEFNVRWQTVDWVHFAGGNTPEEALLKAITHADSLKEKADLAMKRAKR